MNDNPEASLIIPTQGARASLPAALRCAVAQDFGALEVIVVDDAPEGADWRGRPDCAALLADPRVRIVPFHQGRGCAAAKNAGLRAARGRWICYLDDDNLCLPSRVREQHALALETGSPVVLCGIEVRAGGRRRVKQTGAAFFEGDGLLLEALPDTNCLFHLNTPGVEWDEELGTVDDACLFHALISRHGLARVPSVPCPLVIYNTHAGPRANRDFTRHYRGQRRLLVRWAVRHGREARRLHLLRVLVSFCRFPEKRGWGDLLAAGWRLLRAGGAGEWRRVLNAAGSRLPVVSRWMVG